MRVRYFFLVAFLLLSTAITYAQSQKPTPTPLKISKEQQNKPTPQQTERKANQQVTDESTATVKVTPTQPINSEKNNNAKTGDKKSPTDWWKILFDSFLVLFTGILAWSTIGLWRSTDKLWKTALDQGRDMKTSLTEAKRSADAIESVANSMVASGERMEKVFEKQQLFNKMQLRAYISVALLGEIPQDRQTEWKHTIRMNMTNLGNTPACEVKFAIRVDIVGFPLPHEFNLSLFPQQIEGDQLDPRQTKFIEASLDELISDDLITTIQQGISPKLYVWGTVWYKDIFGEPHETNFCQFCMWDIKNTLFVKSADRHNNGT